jgi:peptidoglycan/xylan/chitin deacetylase (PgdA/CDA1 family)
MTTMNLYASRAAAKQALGTILWPFATRFVSRRWIGGGQGLILMFHYIGRPIVHSAGADLFLERTEFAKILDFVASSLCSLEPLEFLSRLRKGTLPPGATLLTFDDCTASVVDESLPELVARGLKACFFANPGLMDAGRTVPCLELMSACARCPEGRFELPLPGQPVCFIGGGASRAAAYNALWPSVIACPSRRQPDLLASLRQALGAPADHVDEKPDETRLASWAALERLVAAGMLVANHTPFHSTANADGVDEFIEDVADGYAIFESHFPSPARIFCYPYGRAVDATPDTARGLRSLGTDYAFVTQGGIARSGEDGLLKLRREGAVYSQGSTKLAPLLAFIR